MIERELMKVTGISAVLSVFGKTRVDMFPFYVDLEDDVTLVASVLIAEGVDIKIELESENMDIRKIQKATVLDVRNHVMTDKSTSCQFQVSYHRRKRYEEKLLR